MANDYLQKKPSKQEQYLEYRLTNIEHDLINLQRQITTVARIAKINPEEFIKELNNVEAIQSYMKELDEAYKKTREANQAAAAVSNENPNQPEPQT